MRWNAEILKLKYIFLIAQNTGMIQLVTVVCVVELVILILILLA